MWCLRGFMVDNNLLQWVCREGKKTDQTDVRLVLNQSVRGKYNLISVGFNQIFLCVCQAVSLCRYAASYFASMPPQKIHKIEVFFSRKICWIFFMLPQKNYSKKKTRLIKTSLCYLSKLTRIANCIFFFYKKSRLKFEEKHTSTKKNLFWIILI